jgi:hypothetical protein
MVDYNPWSGNYTGTTVYNNTIMGAFSDETLQAGEKDGTDSHQIMIKYAVCDENGVFVLMLATGLGSLLDHGLGLATNMAVRIASLNSARPSLRLTRESLHWRHYPRQPIRRRIRVRHGRRLRRRLHDSGKYTRWQHVVHRRERPELHDDGEHAGAGGVCVRREQYKRNGCAGRVQPGSDRGRPHLCAASGGRRLLAVSAALVVNVSEC